MGIDYYLVDRQQRIFYELGKGKWNNLEDIFLHIRIGNAELLGLEIEKKCYCKELYTDTEWQEIYEHIHNRIAPDLIINFGSASVNQLCIINDICGDDLQIIRAKSYICVGSRYMTKDTNEYIENMIYLNRHLKNDELAKRCYNPAQYKGCPEFDKY